MVHAGHDLSADQVSRPAEHGAVVHLALGHVGEQAGRALVGVGVPGQVHAAARRIEGPGEDVGLGVGLHPAVDVGRLALGHAVDRLLVIQAHGFIWRDRNKKRYNLTRNNFTASKTLVLVF